MLQHAVTTPNPYCPTRPVVITFEDTGGHGITTHPKEAGTQLTTPPEKEEVSNPCILKKVCFSSTTPPYGGFNLHNPPFPRLRVTGLTPLCFRRSAGSRYVPSGRSAVWRVAFRPPPQISRGISGDRAYSTTPIEPHLKRLASQLFIRISRETL